MNHGRSHFNYSDWAKYDREEATRLIKNSCDFARKGTMPPYSWMHAEARLSPQNIEALCSWVAN